MSRIRPGRLNELDTSRSRTWLRFRHYAWLLHECGLLDRHSESKQRCAALLNITLRNMCDLGFGVNPNCRDWLTFPFRLNDLASSGGWAVHCVTCHGKPRLSELPCRMCVMRGKPWRLEMRHHDVLSVEYEKSAVQIHELVDAVRYA